MSRLCKLTLVSAFLLVFIVEQSSAGDGPESLQPRVCDPYYVGRDFPKLTTPQWVGEEGVEAVVVLAIDDMRDTAKYEAYLRPILDRLKKIDGRAPVSIMTCKVDPDDPQLQAWLNEGLSIEVHTIDHPCPLLQGGDFAKAKSTYDRCVDLMNEIPGNKPVAFRMPCCDSLNTPSPRFWREIFDKTTENGKYLEIDTSVFNITTSNDMDLPRELVLDSDGTERFRKYLPFKSFVNTIEDYPYPYIIGGTCWEFPCIVPSDWEAQNIQQPNNPKTVEDMKAALDAVVVKQGTFNLVFHPHGWIRNDQIVELIDHAIEKHGKRVKFLTFREAVDRINANLLGGRSLRNADGSASGIGLRDVDDDGKLDVVDSADANTKLSVAQAELPAGVQLLDDRGRDAGLRKVDINEDGFNDIIFSNGKRYSLHLWDPDTNGWTIQVIEGKYGEDGGVGPVIPMIVRADGTNNGAWFHSRSMWVQNEDTNRLPDLVDRLSFDDMLKDYRKQQQDEIPAAKSAEDSRAAIRVRAGLNVELVASEPLVADPVAFDWGADGSLWVAEMGDYPNGATWNKPGDPIGESGGRIKHLIDDDGDGKYDRATLFLDKVAFPNGVKAWRNGILVSAAPEIFYAEDTNGDGVADKRETLYEGFVEGNQQHRVNGLRWGLDNWLYLANGDSGGTVKSLKTGMSIDIRGRDLRIRPDTGELETVSGQTQFGRNRDDWGNWFGGNNSNPMWHYALEDSYLKRNPHYAAPDGKHHVSNVPGASPIFPASRTLTRFNDFDKVDRFTSACSPIVYRDELLFPRRAGDVSLLIPANNKRGPNQGTDVPRPPEVTHVFICEPVHNLVHHEVMHPIAATFASQRAGDELASEFLASSDNWFRPTTVRTGPDGALWISDMYRLVIEHPEWIPVTWQEKLDLRSGHDMGRIYRVVPADKKVPLPLRLDKLDTASLIQALDSPNGWQRDMVQQMLLWRNDVNSIEALSDLAINAKRPLTRLHALCTLDGMNAASTSLVSDALKDEHPGIRRHAVRLAERYINESQTVSATIQQLAGDSDAQVRLQVAYSLGEWRDPRSGSQLAMMAFADHDDRFVVAAALSGIREDNIASALDFALPQAAAHNTLVEQLLSIAIGIGKPELLRTAMRSILRKPSSGFEAWQVTTTTTVLKSFDRRKLDRKQTIGEEIAAELQDLVAEAQRISTDLDAPQSRRLKCIELLGAAASNEQDLNKLAELLQSRNSSAIQLAAVEALSTRGLAAVPKVLLADWSAHLPALRAQILQRLLARTEWTRVLLTSIEAKEIAASEVDARLRQQLLAHRDASIRERSAKLLANVTTSRSQIVNEHAGVASLAGNPESGKLVFTKRCSACHRLQSIGKHVGPDLTALTDKTPAAMLVAILDPNRAVEDKYRDYIAVTLDGRQITGMITNETATAITLTGTDAKEQTILRADLEELRSTGRSLMPEGMEKDLSPQDMADVMAFARSVSAPPKKFPGNEPQVAPARKDGSIRCFAIHARVYGPTLVFEDKLRNLGYWSSIEDHAIWSLETPAAGSYRVSFEYACPNDVAGNRWMIAVGSNTLIGFVEGTGSWENYRTVTAGTIELPAGSSELVFRSDGKIKGHLLDLRSIRLIPQVN